MTTRSTRSRITALAAALLGVAILAVSATLAAVSATQGAGGGKIVFADEGPEELVALTRYAPALAIPRR